MKTKVTVQTSRRGRGRLKVLGAVVTLNTYALANHQATLENRHVSEIGDELWRDYLRKKGTVLEAV